MQIIRILIILQKTIATDSKSYIATNYLNINKIIKIVIAMQNKFKVSKSNYLNINKITKIVIATQNRFKILDSWRLQIIRILTILLQIT